MDVFDRAWALYREWERDMDEGIWSSPAVAPGRTERPQSDFPFSRPAPLSHFFPMCI